MVQQRRIQTFYDFFLNLFLKFGKHDISAPFAGLKKVRSNALKTNRNRHVWRWGLLPLRVGYLSIRQSGWPQNLG